MNKPRYVKIEDRKYEINTDFRVAIRVEEVLRDETINNLEKTLAVIYLLFGETGLDEQKSDKLLEKRFGIYLYG